MRPIDADAFLEANKELVDRDIDHPLYEETVRNLIEKTPTIDCDRGGRLRGVDYDDGKVSSVMISDTDGTVKLFAPVRYGYWTKIHVPCYHGGTLTEYECSICKCHDILASNFCTYCGAKMDEEVKE